jgi:hypothetical protein
MTIKFIHEHGVEKLIIPPHLMKNVTELTVDSIGVRIDGKLTCRWVNGVSADLTNQKIIDNEHNTD